MLLAIVLKILSKENKNKLYEFSWNVNRTFFTWKKDEDFFTHESINQSLYIKFIVDVQNPALSGFRTHANGISHMSEIQKKNLDFGNLLYIAFKLFVDYEN